MKFILFLSSYFSLLFNGHDVKYDLVQNREHCISSLVDIAFSPERLENFYLFLPSKNGKNKNARLVIKKNDFINYLLAIDSTYKNIDSLKAFTKDVLLKKKKIRFNESFYKKKFKSKDYLFLTKKNPIDIKPEKMKVIFLKKYLAFNLGKVGIYNWYNLDRAFSNPEKKYYYICENLFSLNYLVVSGHHETVALEVKCK